MNKRRAMRFHSPVPRFSHRMVDGSGACSTFNCGKTQPNSNEKAAMQHYITQLHVIRARTQQVVHVAQRKRPSSNQ